PLQIDAREFRPTKRKHVGLVCGIVGRLHEDKVPRSFIEAVLAWEPGSWRIRFIGHGLDTGYQQFVKRKLANVSWVDFSGDVTPGKMPSALRGLDAVLIPTDSAQGETGSYTALEAMATGLPVIGRRFVHPARGHHAGGEDVGVARADDAAHLRGRLS